MKRLLSYFYPITKKIPSDVNGVLEITWYNGRKILNSQNANYSYGSLQRILKYALNKIDVSGVQNVLLLGLGGGSVIRTLRENFNYKLKITAVEIDKSIIEIAAKEFNVCACENLAIIYGDAFNYVANFELGSTNKFDLLIIDLFIDNKVPDKFFSPEFWERIESLVAPGGFVIFNASTHSDITSKVMQLIDPLKKTFQFQILDHVEGTNTLVIGHAVK